MENIFEKPGIFIFGGPPGAGKEEQGNRLEVFLKDNSKFGIGRHDNGDSLRKTTKNILYTQHMRNRLDESMNTEGITVPGAITINMWMQTLFLVNDGNSHIIFGGIFRTPLEPTLFVEVTEDYMPASTKYFIRLNVSDEVILERIGKKGRPGRPDDTQTRIRNRIRVYYEDTYPIYDEIADNPNFAFLNIDGEGSKEKVHQEIIRKIAKLQNKLD